MKGQAESKSVITSFIAVLIGVILVPVLQTSVDDANVTGTLAVVLPLVPLLFTLGILLFSVRSMR